MNADHIIEHMKSLGDSSQIPVLSRFFKTAKGEYGEDDIFLGIRVPVTRKQIKLCTTLELNEIEKLLHSSFHECRLLALLTLVALFKQKKSSESFKHEIIKLYLRNSYYVNNWDLVDSSAHYLLGPWLEDKDRSILIDLAHSSCIWERRISIMATFHFIKQNNFEDTFKISDILLNDKHDLIHKAVGWMIREVGNKNKSAEINYLSKRYKKMPRTMLRYAIEKFSKDERANYLRGSI